MILWGKRTLNKAAQFVSVDLLPMFLMMCAKVPARALVICGGGKAKTPNSGNVAKSEVYRFNTDTLQWEDHDPVRRELR